jgi:hypothetical protein
MSEESAAQLAVKGKLQARGQEKIQAFVTLAESS